MPVRPPLYVPPPAVKPPPQVVQPKPDPKPVSATEPTDLSKLIASIDALQKQVAEIELKPGPAGPAGPKGDPGPAGKDGADRKDADSTTINLAITEINAVKARVDKLQNQLDTPLTVQILDENGQVRQQTSVHLGKEPLRLKLVPVHPASPTSP